MPDTQAEHLDRKLRHCFTCLRSLQNELKYGLSSLPRPQTPPSAVDSAVVSFKAIVATLRTRCSCTTPHEPK